MSELTDGRGVLYPAKLPSFHRVPATGELAHLVRWFWLPRWDLAPGRVSRQEVLPFPASNLVVDPDGVTMTGPSTRASYRDLSGSGWAVGALLRPAGVSVLGVQPGDLRDSTAPFDAPDLQDVVLAAMRGLDEAGVRENAVTGFSRWIATRSASPDTAAVQANALEDLVASDRSITRVDQLAAQLGASTRSVQRLCRRYIGLSPLAIIRRYRLQEAAERLREDPTLTVAVVAAELGYADQAHLAADFRRVLALTPNAYRHASRGAS